MKGKKKRNDLLLSASDIEAILCVLPLVSYGITDTVEQAAANTRHSISASDKLSNGILSLTPEEYWVIYLAVASALDILEGVDVDYLEGLPLDQPWQDELRKNFFAYNRLFPFFERAVNPQPDRNA